MGKLRAARQAHRSVTSLDASHLAWLIISVIGMLPLIALAAVALIVLIVILMLSGSQLTSYSPDASSPGAAGSALTQLAGGDGRGTFAGANVPDQDLVAPIRAAARRCGLLTPVIIAAQIEYASEFDAKKEGPEGRKGLSQLTPDTFDRHGEDDDESGEASALDAEDSIHAHARYFCELADETRQLLDAKKVVGDHLTLTLMAWEIGLEAVKLQGGMPVLDLSSYPFQVRGLFARYTSDAGSPPTPGPAGGSPSAPAGRQGPDEN